MGKRWPVWAAVSIVLVIGLAAQAGVPGRTEPHAPAFVETACDVPGVSPEVGARLRCGTVAVPPDYRHPDLGAFKLAVVVVRSARQPALPDPVVYISGGPGSPLTVHADYQARHPYAAGRDLILVDQRGVGRSEPSLCPRAAAALLGADFDVAVAPAGDAQARRQSAFTACRDEAEGRGIDLDGFGTAATAEDFDLVRRALGVARWNVVGESYGTTVAMTLMARHPDTIRSAVLDSVYPPDSILPPWSARVGGARAAFFAMCRRDAACAAAFPDLAELYQQALERLSRVPLQVSVPPWMHRPGDLALLTAPLFELTVAHLLYYPDAYPGLPRLIATVRDARTDVFATGLAGVLAGGEALTIPAYVAVECRDRPRYREPLATGAGALDRASLYDICRGWSRLGPTPVIPAGTDVPTLVLAGAFDPNATPVISRHVADLIGEHARWLVFPLIGHNVIHFSACGRAVAADFIDHTEGVSDAACVGQVGPIRFLPAQPAVTR